MHKKGKVYTFARHLKLRAVNDFSPPDMEANLLTFFPLGELPKLTLLPRGN